jgi:tripartite motif-containing protein 71
MDTHNYRLQVFDGNGKFLAKWGTHGVGEGQFNIPTDVEIDGAGDLYVSNFGNGWIEKFDSQGMSLGRWNDCGTGASMGPGGLAIDQQGNLYVADSANNRICKFNAEGKFIGTRGGNGNGEGQCLSFGDLMVDDDGTVYVPDIQKNQILVFKQKQQRERMEGKICAS